MRTLLIIAVLALFVVPAFADDTSQANWNNDLGKCGNKCREYIAGHNHQYDQYDPQYEAGIGLDLIVFKDRKDQALVPDVVTIENKWDFNNEEGAVYVVATYDLSNLWQK